MRRHANQKSTEYTNTSFKAFCAAKGIPFPDEYRRVPKNYAASFKSLSAYDRPEPAEVDDAVLDLATEWAKQHFRHAMQGARVCTEEEVLPEMDLNTSPGYPWNIAFKSKREFLDDAHARGALNDFYEKLGTPDRAPNMCPIWTCTQKDELRSKEKIATNSFRTFTASPFELTVAGSRLFHDMNNKFYDGYRTTWSFVGATKFMGGWGWLLNRIRRFKRGFCMDGKKYDSSLFKKLLWKCANIRFSMFAREWRTPTIYAKVMDYYDMVINSVIVSELGDLLRKFLGMPSGGNTTISDNTLCLYMLLAYAWIVLALENGIETSYAHFHACVQAALNGDDSFVSVSEDVIGWYNPKNIRRVLERIGVTFTVPDDEPIPVDKGDFLSQTFWTDTSVNPPIVYPVPETARVLGSLAYGAKLDDVRWHYLRACALRLDSYGNRECRGILEDYLIYLDTVHASELFGLVKVGRAPPISMDNIRAVWKSDAFIEALYSGAESLPAAKALAVTTVAFKGQDGTSSIDETATWFKNLLCNESLFAEDCLPLSSLHNTDDICFEIRQSNFSSVMPPKQQKHKSTTIKKVVKAAKAVHKAKAAVQTIKGHGDYRPTQFQRVRGRGDYFGDLLGKAGGFLGNKVGNFLQGGFRKLTGFGDYRSNGPRSNSLYSHPKRNATDSSTPSESSFEMGACSIKFGGKAPRVQHREYIGPVLSTGSAFNTKVYRIQPGLSGIDVLFPWGSSVAGCFQQYELHGAILEYVSTSSDFASNSALGAVMMSTVYDAEATPLASVMEVDNNEYTTTAKPSVSFYHPIECASQDNPTTIRYIRKSNSPSSGIDERLDDVGIFQISTNGLSAAAGTQIGELWITYDVSLLKAELPDVHTGTTAQFFYDSFNAHLGPGTVTPNPMNSLPATLALADQVPGGDGLKIKLPVSYNGNYLISYQAYPITVFNGAPTLNVDVGPDVTILNVWQNGLGNRVSVVTASSTTSVTLCVMVSSIAKTAAANWVDIGLSNPGSWSSAKCNVVITAMDNDIMSPDKALERRARHGDLSAVLELLKRQQLSLPTQPQSATSSVAGSLPPPPSASASAIEEYEEEKWVDQDTPRPIGETSGLTFTDPSNTIENAKAMAAIAQSANLEDSVYLPRGVLSKLLNK